MCQELPVFEVHTSWLDWKSLPQSHTLLTPRINEWWAYQAGVPSDLLGIPVQTWNKIYENVIITASIHALQPSGAQHHSWICLHIECLHCLLCIMDEDIHMKTWVLGLALKLDYSHILFSYFLSGWYRFVLFLFVRDYTLVWNSIATSIHYIEFHNLWINDKKCGHWNSCWGLKVV